MEFFTCFPLFVWWCTAVLSILAQSTAAELATSNEMSAETLYEELRDRPLKEIEWYLRLATYAAIDNHDLFNVNRHTSKECQRKATDNLRHSYGHLDEIDQAWRRLRSCSAKSAAAIRNGTNVILENPAELMCLCIEPSHYHMAEEDSTRSETFYFDQLPPNTSYALDTVVERLPSPTMAKFLFLELLCNFDEQDVLHNKDVLTMYQVIKSLSIFVNGDAFELALKDSIDDLTTAVATAKKLLKGRTRGTSKSFIVQMNVWLSENLRKQFSVSSAVKSQLFDRLSRVEDFLNDW